MEINAKLFKIAYKKLKSSLYYDKTQTILRDKLVNFESICTNIDRYLEELSDKFLSEDTRGEMFEKILSSISFHAFPKKILPEQSVMIKNYAQKNIGIVDNQYFIDMDICGHILGVLWLLLIGYKVDENMYEHSYGNRIRKNLYNEFSADPTYSPYLFEPYFQQYEGWRDTAMNEAMQHLHAGQDVVILTLDFKRFYYSVDVTETLFQEMYNDVMDEFDTENSVLIELHQFMFQIIKRYSACFTEFENRNILPIGFLPSNVLANYALRNFDKAIADGWNPIYYGRYVDDVIIVDKVESNSDLCKKAKANDLDANDIIGYFLQRCSGWKGLNGIPCQNGIKYALLQQEHETDNTFRYVLNKLYNPTAYDLSKIVVQNDKVKIFYFKEGESDALITCFRENIAKNKSEFRHMPEDEAIFQKDDYSKIYGLKNDETLNKFRGISGISIDKYELSKLLGKHLRIGGLIKDVRETGFERHVSKIFNSRVIIENYTVWEKIVEVLVINESWEPLKVVIKNIVEAINSLDYQNADMLVIVKNTMKLYLYATLSRCLALVWGTEIKEIIEAVCRECINYVNDREKCICYLSEEHRKSYCETRMIDKSVMPIFQDMLDMDTIYTTEETLNLCCFQQTLKYSKYDWGENTYVYYPYLVTMYDFSMISCIEQLNATQNQFDDMKSIYKSQIDNYVKSNYAISDNARIIRQIIYVEKFKDKDAYLVQINNSKKNRLKLAIANVRLDHDNFKKVVIDNPNRSYQRYKDLSKIINAAIDENADMLIMPEAYVPFEWLATVARTCARNNLAVVTGIEHIKQGNQVFNLTAVILPYEDLENKSALISFHLKKHYAPIEKQEINGYRLKEVTGKHYELYQWHDCYFPVYCCYELTSIVERAMFQSYADFLVAIEWNRDVNYYSNILESLSRDIHCYCVQVNSSNYGDSRITMPSKTEEKDIMRTKGGKNSTILVDEIDIKKIREFQLKDYNLQMKDKGFKTTPPGFDHKIVLDKIRGEKLK